MSQLLQLMDRPVAFQRSFVRLGVGVTGALLLSQMVYWHNRTDGNWFYKTQAELEEETGLTRYEQEGARKKLLIAGVLEEVKKGIPAKLYFRVNEAALQALLWPEIQVQPSEGDFHNQGCGNYATSDAENQQAGMGVCPKPACGNPASIHTVDYTETTTENKTLGARADASTPTRSAKREYSPEFETAWLAYPKRAGGNPKPSAYKAWNARLHEGVTPETLLAGVKRYAAFVVATGKLGSEYVKQAATFFGPDRHFEETWQAPAVSGGARHTQPPVSGFEGLNYGESGCNW
ncbi:hypothetical protein [Serratia liquefaciens]|uniref:hypothetical protein n=1 Tax=Serratia liquefaciens TaxID=614 RepID=UPI000E0701F7|nr:hypothetical protein [Serratia liquefaciens]CAB1224114.1 hypothetical protein SFB10_3739 [Serratia liquefaciens]CAI1096610.1 Uncharacterised protein [Serratia liquefaciens]SUI44030.1 Uncharacterised protein [Serratia liquefaciens]